MNFYNIKSKSGFKLLYENRQITDSEGYEMHEYKVPVLKSNKLDDFILTEVNLNNLYNELLMEVRNIKEGKSSIENSILILSNNWGYLRVKHYTSSLGSVDKLCQILIKHQIKQISNIEENYGKNFGEIEYNFWKLLIQRVIPATQSWLSTYVKDKHLELSISNLNDCIANGVEVKYKSVDRASYEVIPTTLLSAITMFSKTKRKGKKQPETRICAYEFCNNEFTVNLGYGRPRVTCSDSCRTLKAKHRNKKS